MLNFCHHPRKRFGQNFLVDDAVLQKILCAINPAVSDHLVEVGSGRGALTRELISKVARFDAIEIDRDLVALLQPLFASYQTTACLYSADVLAFDFSSLENAHCAKNLRIVGNLPYNITTPLLFYLFKFTDLIKDLHFMVQREVAERLCAKPGSKIYGRLSVMAQYYCKIESLFDVAPTSFSPVPAVHSSFIRLIPREFSPSANDTKVFAEVVRLAFNQRRKTLHNSLREIMTADEWQKLHIDSMLRPEQLAVGHFVEISNIIAHPSHIVG